MTTEEQRNAIRAQLGITEDRVDLRRLTPGERCEVLELLLHRLGLKVVRAEPGFGNLALVEEGAIAPLYPRMPEADVDD